MKNIITIILFSCIITASEIKEASINAIEKFYNDSIEVISKKFKIPKKAKKEIQNQVLNYIFWQMYKYFRATLTNKND